MVGRRSTFLDEIEEMIRDWREEIAQLKRLLPQIDEEIAVLIRLQGGESMTSVVGTTKPEIIKRLISGGMTDVLHST